MASRSNRSQGHRAAPLWRHGGRYPPRRASRGRHRGSGFPAHRRLARRQPRFPPVARPADYLRRTHRRQPFTQSVHAGGGVPAGGSVRRLPDRCVASSTTRQFVDRAPRAHGTGHSGKRHPPRLAVQAVPVHVRDGFHDCVAVVSDRLANHAVRVFGRGLASVTRERRTAVLRTVVQDPDRHLHFTPVGRNSVTWAGSDKSAGPCKTFIVGSLRRTSSISSLVTMSLPPSAWARPPRTRLLAASPQS